MHKWHLFLLITIMSYASATWGQTVTVAKTGSPTFATVQAAINSFNPDPDAGTPNVIQITDSAVYDEVISISVPCTIVGTGLNRPVLATQNNASDGIVVNIATGTTNSVILRNLIVVPSKVPGQTPQDDGIVALGTNLYFEMRDVVVAPNNGADAPVTTSGLAPVSLAGAVFWGDDPINVGTAGTAGAGFELAMRNTVVTHHQNPATTSTSEDGLVCITGASRVYRILDGCVFSYNGRLGIQANADFEINASDSNRTLILGNKGFAGLWFAGAGTTLRSVRGANILSNGNGTSSGFGIEHQNGGTPGLTLSNSILAGNTLHNLQISGVGITAPINISNVTFANQLTGSAINTDAAETAAINLTNCVVAGNGTTATANTIQHAGSGTLTFIGSSAVTAGPQKLNTATAGAGPIGGAPSTNADPQFVETVNLASASFFDVANGVYVDKSSTGGHLSGGADYVGPTAASDWTLYE